LGPDETFIRPIAGKTSEGRDVDCNGKICNSVGWTTSSRGEQGEGGACWSAGRVSPQYGRPKVIDGPKVCPV